MLIFNCELTHPAEIGLAELERGFFYGDGCFETLRLSRGGFPLWPWHLQRLRETSEAIHLELPDIFFSQVEIERLARLLVPSAAGDCAFRLALWRAGGRGRHIASTRAHWLLQCLGPAPDFFEEVRLASEPVTLPQTQGPHKRLGQSTYATLPVTADGEDVLLVNDRGHILETLNSNVWILHGERLLTPPLSSGCINGVWRRAVFSLRTNLAIPLEECEISAGDLTPQTPLMLGNALRGFHPVPGHPFPQTLALHIHHQLWRPKVP
jgi:branched-chain amino acid aminotransferase